MTEAEEKSALRSRLRKMTASLPEADLAAWDAAITARLLRLEAWARAETVFAYCSVGREVDTWPLLRAALAAGKTLVLPKCGEKGKMQALQVESLEMLVPGAYGIPEPVEGKILSGAEIDLAVVPALAFDRAGFRLGQGGGYYDRWLDGFSGFSVGLCREALLQEALPRQAHDRTVDFVVTEARLFQMNRRA